jgi:tetratricopeptide (TPR) repeat protein
MDDAPEAARPRPGDAEAATGWTDPQPEAAPEAPAPAAPVGAGPGGTNWIEALRRAPVWIPAEGTPIEQVGDAWSEGASMELESVIDSFREQMARALDGDGAARYDLGVAYYDMGLYNEALAEFEAASRCPGLEVQSFEMLASCLLQTGRHHEVVELLLPVLAADGHSPRGRLGLQYSLGLAYEALGDPRQARRCFEEVALVDIDFKDVQSRLQRV